MSTTRAKWQKIEDTALVAPVNNYLHSLFNEVDVFSNQKAVSPPSNAYAYRTYIETLFNYCIEAKKNTFNFIFMVRRHIRVPSLGYKNTGVTSV